MPEALDQVWKRSDEHSKQLTALQIEQAIHKSTLDNHAAQISQISRENSERHGQLVAMMDSSSAKMDTVIADYNQQKGAAGFKQFVIPVVISLIGLALALGIVNGAT